MSARKRVVARPGILREILGNESRQTSTATARLISKAESDAPIFKSNDDNVQFLRPENLE
jgi:hypothetical protein